MTEERELKSKNVTDFLQVKETEHGAFFVVHLPTNCILRKTPSPVGLEEGFWLRTVRYAENISKLNIDWEEVDIEELTMGMDRRFITEILDPLGLGKITTGRASALIMQRIIRTAA